MEKVGGEVAASNKHTKRRAGMGEMVVISLTFLKSTTKQVKICVSTASDILFIEHFSRLFSQESSNIGKVWKADFLKSIR